MHFSERGIPLVNCSGSRLTPIITVENYVKWYGLYLIHVNGEVEIISPDIMDEINASDPVAIRGDHCYHPRLLYRLASKLEARICPQSLEVVIGRWLMDSGECDDAVKSLKFNEPPRKS